MSWLRTMPSFLGKSKVARKFILLFLISAFLPTFGLMFFFYERISAELLDQNVNKLVRETKTYGFSLYERLSRLGDQLSFLGHLIEQEGVEQVLRMQDGFAEMAELFDELVLVTDASEQTFIVGNSLSVGESVVTETFKERNSRVSLFSVTAAHGFPAVFLSLPVVIPQGGSAWLVAKVNFQYLWGIGMVPLLPAATELTVYDRDGLALVSTYASPAAADTEIEVKSDEILEYQEYVHDGHRYLAGKWDLFLEAKFGAGTWTVVLAQSEDYLLASLKSFKRNLFLAILLGLWLILLVSLILIRRGLAPLGELKERTRQIAAQDFSSEIKLKTGDEFEELAVSFNAMSRQLGKQFAALEAIDKIDRAILGSITLPDIIRVTLPMLKTYFECETVILGLAADRSEDYLKVHILSDEWSEPVAEYITIHDRQKGVLFRSESPFVWPRGLSDLARIDRLRRYGDGTIVSVALLQEQQVKGIVILAHAHLRAYDDIELKQLRQLADQVSIALSNSELLDNLERLANGTIEALARTVDAKSKWTSGHSERVSVLAGMIGAGLGLAEEQVLRLNRGGLLHDIGKIGVSRSILDKPSRLTEEEYAEIMSHPERGVRILEPIQAYQDILPMIQQHHERYDGSGYPNKLAGDDIDFTARILAVADVYDALTSMRPYRPGWSRAAALDYISAHSGSHFDPEVVKVFRTIIH